MVRGAWCPMHIKNVISVFDFTQSMYRWHNGAMKVNRKVNMSEVALHDVFDRGFDRYAQ